MKLNQARGRVDHRGTVSATTSDALLASTLQAPSLGNYTTVAATLPGFALKDR